MYSLTGSVFLLGLTGLVEAVPAILCALYAGHVVDTHKPLRIYILCLTALGINTLVLLVLAGGLFTFDSLTVLIVLYAGVFISGLARSFIMPASFSLLPLIIKRSEIPAASSVQTMTYQAGAIGGPTLAGLIYGGYGAMGAWLFAALMMGMAVVMVMFLKVAHAARPEKRPRALASIIEGWKFLLQNRALLSVMALDMLAVLFGGAIAVLPAFAHEVLQAGSEGLGALRAAPAVGAVIGALYYTVVPMRRVNALQMLGVIAGFGVCMIGFGLSTHFIPAVLFLALSGAFDSVSMVIRGTLVQWLTPEAMRGRVASVNSMFIISSNEIGAFYSGAMAALLGLVPSIVLGGAGTLAVVGLTALLSPKFRKLRVEA